MANSAPPLLFPPINLPLIRIGSGELGGGYTHWHATGKHFSNFFPRLLKNNCSSLQVQKLIFKIQILSSKYYFILFRSVSLCVSLLWANRHLHFLARVYFRKTVDLRIFLSTFRKETIPANWRVLFQLPFKYKVCWWRVQKMCKFGGNHIFSFYLMSVFSPVWYVSIFIL